MYIGPTKKRMIALDGLRGIAAVLVLLHHALLMLPDFANYEWQVPEAVAHGPIEWLLFYTPMRLMWAGQERAILFFVLNSFVLSLPWLNGKTMQHGRFLLSRFCRLYPPYLIAMVVAALGSFLLGGHHIAAATVYFNQLGWSFRPSWGVVPSILSISNDRTSEFVNEAIWSLVWEVRVALIFPLLILPIVRWRGFGIVGVLLALYIFQYFGQKFVSDYIDQLLNYPERTFYFAQHFVLGATVAAYRDRITLWFNRRSQSYGVVCLVLGCLICWAPWPQQHDRIVGVGAATIIVAVLGSLRVQKWLEHRALLWLGKQSYSLYLIHVPLVMAVIVEFGGMVPVWACLALLPITIVVAEAFHQAVELPSVALTQRWVGVGRPEKQISSDLQHTSTIALPRDDCYRPTSLPQMACYRWRASCAPAWHNIVEALVSPLRDTKVGQRKIIPSRRTTKPTVIAPAKYLSSIGSSPEAEQQAVSVMRVTDFELGRRSDLTGL